MCILVVNFLDLHQGVQSFYALQSTCRYTTTGITNRQEALNSYLTEFT